MYSSTSSRSSSVRPRTLRSNARICGTSPMPAGSRVSTRPVSQSTVTANTLARRFKVSMLSGCRRPDSYWVTVGRATPKAVASCSWVMLRPRRASRTLSANVAKRYTPPHAQDSIITPFRQAICNIST